MVVLLPAHALEVGTALAALLDPFPGEGPALDIGQDLLHPGADGGGDERRPARVIAVFRGVRDRVAHELHAPAVHQIHDELELVQALEVRELGGVARGDEGLEAGLDERRDSPAQHHLLAEQVAFGLLAERGGQHAGAGAADPHGIRECVGERLAARVALDGDERRHAPPRLEFAAHQMPGRLGRHHRDVHARRRYDLLEVDVEAVGEHESFAGDDRRRDVLLVHRAPVLVGDEHHHDVRRPGRVRHRAHVEPLGRGAGPRPPARAQPDDDCDAALAQVERMGVSLAAVTDDRDGASA